MRSSHHLAAVLLVAVVAVACGATSPGSSGGTGGSSCNELAGAASQEVAAVIQAHGACTQASDCAAVDLSASCFDSCSRAVRADAEADVKAAKAKVDGAQCKQFLDQGCKPTIPPCSPPQALTCTGGVCTN